MHSKHIDSNNFNFLFKFYIILNWFYVQLVFFVVCANCLRWFCVKSTETQDTSKPKNDVCKVSIRCLCTFSIASIANFKRLYNKNIVHKHTYNLTYIHFLKHVKVIFVRVTYFLLL